ncbi:unnamed protein product [Paramecium pentaurelia]|uniref:Homeodomain protein n=1 Tax=Paramecium pentaurelia TaxID=43138 RepID=A0A8S1XQ62_9CILI|nr:unnamed protein product [Paramecium pentaurelia]
MLISEVSATYNQNQRRDNKDVVFKYVYQWNDNAEEQLKKQFQIHQGNWKSISQSLNGPSPLECMIKWQSLNPNQTLSRQLWSQEEDEQLKELVKKYGKKWSKICTVMNWRTGKQVRERYLNQLQMHINNEKWTDQEDKMILKLYKKFGTKWSYISSLLNGRPENMVKNRFYATLKRRFQKELDVDDQSQDSEDSQESYNINKYKKKKKQRPYKLNNDSTLIKKCQLQDASQQIFKRITRSKNNNQQKYQIKQENTQEQIQQLNIPQNKQLIEKQEQEIKSNQLEQQQQYEISFIQQQQQQEIINDQIITNYNQIPYNPIMLFQPLQNIQVPYGYNYLQQVGQKQYQQYCKFENIIDQNQQYSNQHNNYQSFIQPIYNQKIDNYNSQISDISQLDQKDQ